MSWPFVLTGLSPRRKLASLSSFSMKTPRRGYGIDFPGLLVHLQAGVRDSGGWPNLSPGAGGGRLLLEGWDGGGGA